MPRNVLRRYTTRPRGCCVLAQVLLVEAETPRTTAVNLLPLDSPELIELAAEWCGLENNARWLDFGNGVQVLSPLVLKVMAQRELHVLRAYTSDDDDRPIGLVSLSNVDRRSKTAGSLWAVLGPKHSWALACRAASKLLTLAFTELGLEVVAAWCVEINWPARRMLEHLNFHYIGRQRRCHWIDGRPYDRLLYDLLATDHQDTPLLGIADEYLPVVPPPGLRLVARQPERPSAS
jgi:RimJ/RimL family protein N-acetyltransferase